VGLKALGGSSLASWTKLTLERNQNTCKIIKSSARKATDSTSKKPTGKTERGGGKTLLGSLLVIIVAKGKRITKGIINIYDEFAHGWG